MHGVQRCVVSNGYGIGDTMSNIDHYVTSPDADIFALTNLPEVIKGALFARYSRTEKSVRDLLQDEFMDAAAMDIDAANAFYDRVLLGYGDDSVAELGGSHVACERVSNLVSQQLVDSRLGISPLEKSSRYVNFGRKDQHGNYGYYRDPVIMRSKHAKQFIRAMDTLFDTYNALLTPLMAHIYEATHGLECDDERYGVAVRAQAFDALRGLLPMAAYTNIGLHGTGRAFEYMLIKLRSFGLAEYDSTADGIETALKCVIPAFVKRASSNRGYDYSAYLYHQRHTQKRNISVKYGHNTPRIDVDLVDYSSDVGVYAHILYERNSGTPLCVCYQLARQIDDAAKRELLSEYIGVRSSRHQHAGRALEHASYTFEITCDIGAYRDLHRHRICTQIPQAYTCNLGYTVPTVIQESGLSEQYVKALNKAKSAYDTLYAAGLTHEAQYCVPFAFKIQWSLHLNYREATHLIELRSQKQGHESYRGIAQKLYTAIHTTHPIFAEHMIFADMNKYSLARL